MIVIVCRRSCHNSKTFRCDFECYFVLKYISLVDFFNEIKFNSPAGVHSFFKDLAWRVARLSIPKEKKNKMKTIVEILMVFVILQFFTKSETCKSKGFSQKTGKNLAIFLFVLLPWLFFWDMRPLYL